MVQVNKIIVLNKCWLQNETERIKWSLSVTQ